MEQEVTIMKEFEQLKPFLLSAQLGSYVVLPLKYRKEELDQVWLKANCEKQDITTTNLTEQAKILFKENDPMHVGVCYKFQRETFIKELLDNIEVENVMGFAVTDLDQDRIELGINWEKDGFDIHSDVYKRQVFILQSLQASLFRFSAEAVCRLEDQRQRLS